MLWFRRKEEELRKRYEYEFIKTLIIDLNEDERNHIRDVWIGRVIILMIAILRCKKLPKNLELETLVSMKKRHKSKDLIDYLNALPKDNDKEIINPSSKYLHWAIKDYLNYENKSDEKVQLFIDNNISYCKYKTYICEVKWQNKNNESIFLLNNFEIGSLENMNLKKINSRLKRYFEIIKEIQMNNERINDEDIEFLIEALEL